MVDPDGGCVDWKAVWLSNRVASKASGAVCEPNYIQLIKNISVFVAATAKVLTSYCSVLLFKAYLK